MEVTLEQARKVFDVVGYGLCDGVGTPNLGKMCVEAAVCYALGLPHGDDPPCVADVVRVYKITLNDAYWESNEARGKAFEKIAICQLGSNVIDQRKFIEKVTLEVIRQILPLVLEAVNMPDSADKCRNMTGLSYAVGLIGPLAAYIDEAMVAGDLESNGENSVTAVDYVTTVLRKLETGDDAHLSFIANDIGEAAACAVEAAGVSVLYTAIQIGIDALTELKSPGVELWNQLEAEGYTTRKD
jgi:hypothetical protein